jgi:hypothetical protein
MKNLDSWMGVYETKLMEVVSDPKNGYCYGPSEVPGVVAKMRDSFASD